MDWQRRNLIKAALSGLAGLSAADVLKARASQQAKATDRKSVILLWMAGGPSQIDTWDPKPDRPLENRGPFAPIATALPGLAVCEHLPKQAALLDKFTIIRSVDCSGSGHSPSAVMQTGNRRARPLINPRGSLYPSIGSLVAKFKGANQPGMPPYVAFHRDPDHVPGGGYLGMQFDPLNGHRAAGLPDYAGFGRLTGYRAEVDQAMHFTLPEGVSERRMRVAEQNDGLSVVDLPFFNECLDCAGAAVKAALPKARVVTHVAHGEGRVEKVASNRRVALDAQGRVRKMRGSSCRDAELVAMPEGLIDSKLKTVAFYHGTEKLVACHYYATHPMSHYGRGHVSSDFVGLARKRRQKEQPACTHIYFTGAAGNIAAGKYNDGSPEARVQLTDRIYQGLLAAEQSLNPKPIQTISWKTQEILPPTNPIWNAKELKQKVANKQNSKANRIRPAMVLGWMQRAADRLPIVVSALHVDDISLLHLPAESFIEYQLRAQRLASGRFVATAAYGDGGPWYIPIKEAYPQGGYEVSVANCSPAVDDILSQGVCQLF